jgi:epsilon-lactone hydrolase
MADGRGDTEEAADGAAPGKVPAPPSVSQDARAYLELLPAAGPWSYPALDDTEGWLKLVEASDRAIHDRFTGIDLPVESEERHPGGVHTYVLHADGVDTGERTPLYIDLHGGGLIFGGGEVCRITGASAAMTSRMITWSVDYRMPPLHPYPAALDDCLAVYRAALEIRDPSAVYVGGSSAGGNLAAALMLRIKDEGLPMPAALVLCTPEVDLTESGDTFRTLAHVNTGLCSLEQANLLYAGGPDGADLADPYLSPLFGDLSGLPPTFLQAGTRDLFLSNAVRMHRKLLASGVEAELHVFEAMPHGGFSGLTREDEEMQEAIRDFLDRHRGGS